MVDLYMIEALELKNDLLTTGDVCAIYLMEKRVDKLKDKNQQQEPQKEYYMKESTLKKVLKKIIATITKFIEKVKKFFTGDTKKIMDKAKNDHRKSDPECERSIKEIKRLIKKGEKEELTEEELKKWDEYKDKLHTKMKVAKTTGIVAVSGAALYGLYMDLIGIAKQQEKTKNMYKKAEKLAKQGKKDEVDKIVKKFKNQHNPVMIKVTNTLTKIFNPRNLVQFTLTFAGARSSVGLGKTIGDNYGTAAGIAATAVGTTTAMAAGNAIHNELKKVSNKKAKETGKIDVYNTRSKFSEKGIKEWNDKFEKLRDSIDKS